MSHMSSNVIYLYLSTLTAEYSPLTADTVSKKYAICIGRAVNATKGYNTNLVIRCSKQKMS